MVLFFFPHKIIKQCLATVLKWYIPGTTMTMVACKSLSCMPCPQVIPVQHRHALYGVPRIAAVFQNDCLYLAHHMVTLGHEFRQQLPPPANEIATMVDTIPLLRELAAHRYCLYCL